MPVLVRALRIPAIFPNVTAIRRAGRKSPPLRALPCGLQARKTTFFVDTPKTDTLPTAQDNADCSGQFPSLFFMAPGRNTSKKGRAHHDDPCPRQKKSRIRNIPYAALFIIWSGRLDLNQRLPAPKAVVVFQELRSSCVNNSVFIIKLNWLKTLRREIFEEKTYLNSYPKPLRAALPHPHRQSVIPAEITKRIAAEICCRGSFPAERQSNTRQPPALGRYSWNENRGQMESVEVAA